MAKILVVDDEATITTHLEEKLQMMGYEVVGRASSGPEAVALARQKLPDLVLMDIVMEGEYDGIEAARIIYQELEIPTVFLTAYGDDYFIARAKSVQPLGYVLKPFQDIALKAAIDIALFNREIIKRIKESEEFWRLLTEKIEEAIIIANGNFIIFFWNRGAELIFRYPASKACGQSILSLFSESSRPEISQELELAITTGKPPFQGRWVEAVGLRGDWSKFPVEIHVSPFFFQNKTMFILLARDISDRIKSEKILRATLQEKERLLDEIRKQIKNNLQAIFSLIDFRLDLLREGQTSSMLRESRDRIQTIALMKEKLEKSQTLGKIDFQSYIHNLILRIMAAYKVDPREIRVEIDMPILMLDVKTATLCGLLISELVTNAIKYAFPHGQPGLIRIEARRLSPEKLSLIIADNGIGLPPEISLKSPKTLGFQIVRELVSQLQGTLIVKRQKGTKFYLTLKAF